MNALKLRIAITVVSAALVVISVSSLLAEALRPNFNSFPPTTSNSPTPTDLENSTRAAALAPYWSDLAAVRARVLMGMILSGAIAQTEIDRSGLYSQAHTAVEVALALAPSDSHTWLLRGALFAQQNPKDRLLSESLKMSYLTAPNDISLIPVRLRISLQSEALSDRDLKELFRGDVRLLLVHRPDLSGSLLQEARQATAIGRAALREIAQNIDPKFASRL
jgi:hypothetical protein